MCQPEKNTALGKYLETKLAVIEVKDGETQEEAWRRYLTLNPGYANTHIKIFHYPAKKPTDKPQPDLKLLPAGGTRENSLPGGRSKSAAADP
ncbi:MAG: hypothetical protein ACOC6L_03735 [Thermodesulfobacteriota bacterium]